MPSDFTIFCVNNKIWNYLELIKFLSESQNKDITLNIIPEAIDLHGQLDLPMAIFEGEQSQFFKQHYRSNWSTRGIMVREIDVIRQQEGW